LKNSLDAHFGPRMGPKHTVFGAFWTFWSLISNDFQLNADFFNRLTRSANFASTEFSEVRAVFVLWGIYCLPMQEYAAFVTWRRDRRVKAQDRYLPSS
jgi:succinate-acetate transporter protein